jgi:20S proteasome alpha/beta subunit
MTLIVAIPAEDGLVFASDSQISFGLVRSSAQKIFPVNTHILWAGAGESALIQRVAEGVEILPQKERPLLQLRDDIANVVKGALQSLLALDWRVQFQQANYSAQLDLHSAKFLFVESRDKPRMLHISTYGIPEWVQGRFAAAGNGEAFALALLQKYEGLQMNVCQAKVLASKVIGEAIQVVSHGLAGPMDVWVATADGVHRVQGQELMDLHATARDLRSREIDLLRELHSCRTSHAGTCEVQELNDQDAAAINSRLHV